MIFGKKTLTTLRIAIALLTFTSTNAAEKRQSMDAIWNSAGVQNGQGNQRIQSRATTNGQFIKVNSKKQNLAKIKQLSKLARQRAAWRAKWEAQQRAKKTTQTNKLQLNLRKKLQKKPVSKQKSQIAAKINKPLTREQYIWRWKQAQLKKQQVQGNRHNVNPQVTSNIAKQAKSNYPKFRPTHQQAAHRTLPYVVKNKLKRARLQPHAMSAYVQAVNSPRPLLGHQEQTSRVPASVMKLITSYAALGTLGPNYRWPLDVYTKGRVQNGTLQGDLIIKGYGSPEFDTNALRKVLQGIRSKGIRNVSGRVVFDDSYFNVISAAAGSFDGKSQAAYNAKPDALLFNERINTFSISARGKRVKVSSVTPTHNLKIVNRMRKYKRSCRPKIAVSYRGEQTIVTFSGGFARRCGTRTYTRVISRPANMIYGSMKAMWKRDVGGTLNARFTMGRAPANARPLLRTYSRTLAQILPSIDKDSNNVMARQLLLTIGAKQNGRGTERNGANAIGSWLKSRGLNFPELRIENGAGLSRVARISARHVGDLLMDAYRSPYRNYLMQSLAVAGVDGTMKRRLKSSRVRGRGFFKTGTLRDVRSIAGYVKAADGKTYVMAILHNDPRARRRARPAHDQLIEWVYSGGQQQQLALR